MSTPETPAQGPGGNPDEALNNLREKFSPFIRPAWFPVTTASDNDATGSKFSGKPVLKKGESWPLCANCNKPMQLFVQLNLSQLPKEADVQGEGYLQMFYCTSYEPHCEVECEAFFPFATSTLLRIVNEDEATADHQVPDIKDYFPAMSIERWEEVRDYPGYEEREEEGLELSDEEQELSEQRELAPQPGDKLNGWPLWVQSIEYPSCPECGSVMQLVLQVDSENNVPYMWGDSGVGHITQCSSHPHRLAFGWACY
jgi:uncharacterized protein YwqG